MTRTSLGRLESPVGFAFRSCSVPCVAGRRAAVHSQVAGLPDALRTCGRSVYPDRVNSATALKSWLTRRTEEQLVELLEQRELPYSGGGGLDNPARLADHLLSDGSVNRALHGLNQAQFQVLVAIAVLAEQLHGPAPTPVGRLGPAGFAGWQPAGAGRPVVPPVEPSERPVPRAVLRAALGGPDGEIEEILEQLAERALVLPPHGAGLCVPALLHQQAGELQGYGRPVDTLLSSAYKAAEIHQLAAGLGLAPAGTRDAAQRLIVRHFQDRETLRQAVAQAPAEAADLLDRLVQGPPLLRTRCFVPEPGQYYSTGIKYRFRPEGSGDLGTDWLAARGLVVPIGPDLAELPYEVAAALREGSAPVGYDPRPPAIACAQPLPAHLAGEAQSAATATASRVELLLRATAAQPLAIRKAGGIAVRDTRRLAKLLGGPEAHTRLWLDLSANAGLIAPHRDAPAPTRGRKPAPPPPARMLPTERYDSWLAGSPAERLVPLIATWAVTPEVFSHWPDEDETPVALVSPQDPTAVELRRALLEALATLKAGTGVGPAATLAPESLAELVHAAAWHRPAVLVPDDATWERAAATLTEAELLGVVAHGALTPVGRATLELLRAGADRYFPAVPGTGVELTDRPVLAVAVDRLRSALHELLPPPRSTARFQADLTVIVSGAPSPNSPTCSARWPTGSPRDTRWSGGSAPARSAGRWTPEPTRSSCSPGWPRSPRAGSFCRSRWSTWSRTPRGPTGGSGWSARPAASGRTTRRW